MRRIFHLAILMLILAPVTSLAWQPCMIFCDAGCGGAAITSMGSSVSSAQQSQTEANQNHLESINEVNQSVIDLGVDLTDKWTSTTMDLLSALDARTNKIELAETMSAKSKEYNTDTINFITTKSLKGMLISENISANNSEFSNASMPETGSICANAASSRKEGYFKAFKLEEEILNVQEEYSNELNNIDQAYVATSRLPVDEDTYNPTLMICEKTISDEDLKLMENLVLYLTNPFPLPMFPEKKWVSPDIQEYEVKRRIYNAKSKWVAGVLNKVLASRAELSSSTWVQSYAHVTSNNGKLSNTESISSLVEGRVSSDGYYLNIKSLSEPGLNRELVYLKAEENALLFLLSQRRELRNQILAMLVLEKSERPRLIH